MNMEERTAESTSPSSPMGQEELEGVLFGKYEIRRLLGVGSFAKVYEAYNLLTKKRVAIKVVSKRGMMEQFQTEISAMRRLKHPHIVELYEVLATETKFFLVMELARGGELHHKFHCHSRGVFHRDLKLDNILLDQNLSIKVSDFGLSATRSDIRCDGKLHAVRGPPAYMAPEMLNDKGYDGDKVDVWQCGVVLYMLTFESMPLTGPDVKTPDRRIPPRRGLHPPLWVSALLRHLIKRLLDPNPETRITINEILKDNWFNKGFY
ncbi:hypothetical protein K1719_026832 [Acacia pycnantha]|nr:hypothetical protein K1719_026832 [Acacia pycnantha]